MLKIGVFGCGAIGTELCKAIDSGHIDVELYAVYDRHEQATIDLEKQLRNMDPKVLEIAEMVKHVDLVVECASQQAVYEVVPTALHAKCDVMAISVGAFADQNLLKTTIDLAKEYDCKIYLPSGAIAGLDGLKSASAKTIYSVTLTTEKHPRSLAGAPHVIQNNIDLDAITGKTVIFDGMASEAVKAFPANVNVAASLSIAGIGFDNTKVKIVANPALSRNIHEITVEGEFGMFTSRVENVPAPTNPKTSYLAALSAISTLKKIASPLQVGT
ncbi:aspartate dehydrogenase [Methanococcoides sp. NM1]|uniref:aspartate dehydrogenase n=1 Tax=Methanococcoides sp. NM1 TaxID=1201013 RepID=UPI001082DC39|nr:aspartate dehydrogenase [Methanococcoides sp. NM1]